MYGSVCVGMCVSEKKIAENKDISKTAMPLTRIWWASALEI